MNLETESVPLQQPGELEIPKSWDEILSDYKDNIQTIDLRHFKGADVISALSCELRYLGPRAAMLFVLNNRLPGIFLDKLVTEKLDYHIKVITDGESEVLIFHYELMRS